VHIGRADIAVLMMSVPMRMPAVIIVMIGVTTVTMVTMQQPGTREIDEEAERGNRQRFRKRDGDGLVQSRDDLIMPEFQRAHQPLHPNKQNSGASVENAHGEAPTP
jgi:hypothetical protein